MGKPFFLAVATALFVSTPVSVQAANWVLDFEELQRGEIVENQYASGIPGAPGTSLVITADGGQADLAVAFDTHAPTTGGSGWNDGDPDLSNPFNNTSTDFGNILIVQEGFNGTTPCGSGATCLGGGVIPDDSLGGSITFDFGDTPINLTSFDYFDIENSSQGMSVEITYADSSMVTQQMPLVGDHAWGVFEFAGSLGQNVSKLVAVFKGTGAIDNLRGNNGTTTSVSEPHSLAMFLVGLIGFAVYCRRRSPAI